MKVSDVSTENLAYAVWWNIFLWRIPFRVAAGRLVGNILILNQLRSSQTPVYIRFTLYTSIQPLVTEYCPVWWPKTADTRDGHINILKHCYTFAFEAGTKKRLGDWQIFLWGTEWTETPVSLPAVWWHVSAPDGNINCQQRQCHDPSAYAITISTYWAIELLSPHIELLSFYPHILSYRAGCAVISVCPAPEQHQR